MWRGWGGGGVGGTGHSYSGTAEQRTGVCSAGLDWGAEYIGAVVLQYRSKMGSRDYKEMGEHIGAAGL